ncbi:MAG TPA: aminopeptidase P N-terminal domain-containing protein, partial [Armatimonadota bacterium]
MPSNAEPLNLRHPFPPEEYAARRARVYDRLGAGAKALLQGAGPVRGFQAFRQTNDFHYLCGVELPQCCLLLDADSRAATLFLPPRDPHASSEGDVLGAEDAAALVAETGLDAVHDSSALADHLREAARLYTPFASAEGSQGSRDVLLHADKKVAADPWDGRPSREEWLRGLLAQRLPGLELADLSPVLDELRSVKSPREVALCRRAGELSAQAVLESMKATRPGLREYHLGAIADFVFAAGGARGQGYRPIIPSGANIWYSHYFRNDAELREGDLILMDCAPDLCNYTSDIGRMWPVSGSYSPQQRELYGFMVRYH